MSWADGPRFNITLEPFVPDSVRRRFYEREGEIQGSISMWRTICVGVCGRSTFGFHVTQLNWALFSADTSISSHSDSKELAVDN